MHLAGIVPVAGAMFDFGFDWHDCLMPIDQNYTAVERAVYECAMAGCHTIWVIANHDMQPLIKNRVGEWIQDPVWYGRKHDRYPTESRKEIPVYYVPIHPKDRDRRDSLGWSILYGAYASYTTSNSISNWLVPHKYYCAFPYGVYEPSVIREYRAEIASRDTSLIIQYQDKTVKDNEYLGFTFNGEDFKRCRNYVNEVTTKSYHPPKQGDRYPTERLSAEDRWSARHFDLQTVFKQLTLEKKQIISLPWYFPINSWSNYKEYIASDYSIIVPSDSFRKTTKRNKLHEEVSKRRSS
tara:strand:- start:800 stop:1684 length:885 start_codon:yes stop_codon:yes gene_type:complete